MADKSPLDPEVLFEHVQDADYFHVPGFMGGHIYLPQPLITPMKDEHGNEVLDHHGHPVAEPIWESKTGVEIIDNIIQPLDLRITKFMVLEVVAAVIVSVLFIRLASRMRSNFSDW